MQMLERTCRLVQRECDFPRSFRIPLQKVASTLCLNMDKPSFSVRITAYKAHIYEEEILSPLFKLFLNCVLKTVLLAVSYFSLVHCFHSSTAELLLPLL